MMGKKIIKRSLITGMIFYSLLSYSQTSPNGTEFDQKYTPNQNSIFNNLNRKNTESGGSSDVSLRNNIQFWPSMLAREKLFLTYDLDLGHGFCLSFGLGKAFGNDVIQNLAFAIQEKDDALSPNKLLENAVYTGSSPLISLGGKIYFSGETFNEGYITVAYRYEKMNYLLNPSINSVSFSGSRDLSFAMNAVYFGFGYTATTGSKNNFTHDFAMNFGIKYFSYTEFLSYNVQTTYGTMQMYRPSGSQTTARILPAISVSYAFGFGF